MSSSIKYQTIDGFVNEYATQYGISPMDALQTSLSKEFIEYADERDTYKYLKEKEEKGEK